MVQQRGPQYPLLPRPIVQEGRPSQNRNRQGEVGREGERWVVKGRKEEELKVMRELTVCVCVGGVGSQ